MNEYLNFLSYQPLWCGVCPEICSTAFILWRLSVVNALTVMIFFMFRSQGITLTSRQRPYYCKFSSGAKLQSDRGGNVWYFIDRGYKLGSCERIIFWFFFIDANNIIPTSNYFSQSKRRLQNSQLIDSKFRKPLGTKTYVGLRRLVAGSEGWIPLRLPRLAKYNRLEQGVVLGDSNGIS